MSLTTRFLTVLPLVLTVACGPSQVDSQDTALQSLIAAERAFASTSVTSGTRTAFLEFFAADGVVFDTGPVNARAVWEQRPAEGGVLSWGPEIVDVSAAGDMGYTSGPWEMRATLDAEPVAWGHFISVWRRDSSGSWRVATDGGVGHGPVALKLDGPVVRFDGGTGEAPDPADVDVVNVMVALADVDQEYSITVAASGFEVAMEKFVGLSARFYRNGHLPIAGRDSITAYAAVTDAVWTEWEQVDVGVSSAGDMGFTYGVVEFTPELGASLSPWTASYYRIWKRSSESIWLVVVDVLIPYSRTSE